MDIEIRTTQEELNRHERESKQKENMAFVYGLSCGFSIAAILISIIFNL